MHNKERYQIKISNQDIKLGIKAGLSFSDVTGDVERSSAFLGSLPLGRYHIGGFVEFRLSDKFSIQPEILYSRKGFASKRESIYGWNNDGQYVDLGITRSRNQLNYLDLPFMMKYYLIRSVGIEFGPQMSFLLSSTQRLKNLQTVEKSGFKTIDFGLNLGLSVDVSQYVFLGARYNIGVSDILIEKNKQAYNRVFQISVGAKF